MAYSGLSELVSDRPRHDLAASGLAAVQAKESRRLPVEWRKGDEKYHQFKRVKRQASMRWEITITKDMITIGKVNMVKHLYEHATCQVGFEIPEVHIKIRQAQIKICQVRIKIP